jgi:hypothetical protein
MQNTLPSPATIIATLKSIELDLQKEMRDFPDYNRMSGEHFIESWPMLWQSLQRLIRCGAYVGMYSQDTRLAYLNRTLAQQWPQLLESQAVDLKSIP